MGKERTTSRDKSVTVLGFMKQRYQAKKASSSLAKTTLSNHNQAISHLEAYEVQRGPISYLKSESEALKTILEKQKVFRQPGLKLSDLSNRLNVSPRKLSFLINSQYNMNFNELINECRTNDALELIEEGYLEKYTAESLFEATGFQNKTSFYKAFKAKTGTTPSSYLKMVS